MKVFTFVSYLTSIDGDWKQDDYHASKFIKAIKRLDVNGYAMIPVGGSRRQLDATNREAADVWFAIWAWDFIRVRLTAGAVLAIVPFPSSTTVVGSNEDFTARRLAQAIAARSPSQMRVADVLRFKKPLQRAREGGTRDPREIIANLQVVAPIGRGPFVLLDDVTTKGGHLQAAVRLLANSGAQVSACMCVGWSLKIAPAEPFKICDHDIADDW